jgi:catechol 2,3-dioxygenase-like lactoylglutathione lyase family enzyme
MFTRLHHMQIAMPRDAEPQARAFYADVLGMTEVPKPEVMARRGGAWFRAGGVELHLGAEDEFRPDRKGHPGILVDDLDAAAARLTDAGLPIRWDDDFPGFRRFYAADPFGNRLEFLQER